MGRIVVGVDGSSGSRVALRWALDEAARRHAEVDAILVWRNPAALMNGYVPVVMDLAELEAAAKQSLDVALAGERTDVRVNPIVVDGVPAKVLLEAAQGAEMLVVGTRGHGGFVGLLLGSVSHSCALHATCPVVVVPS